MSAEREFVFVVTSANAEPPWFQQQTENTWTTVAAAGTPAAAGCPNNAVMDAWTGGCVNQAAGEFMLAANGGHGDYGGNEVYLLNLRASTPAWVKATSASVMTGGTTGTNAKGDFGDGRMRAVHGYNRCTFGDGRVWYAAMDGMYSLGYWSTAVWSARRSDFAQGSVTPWTYHGLAISSIGSNFDGEGGAAVYDRIGKRVWATAGRGALTNGTGVWSVSTDDATLGQVTTYPIAHNSANGNGSWAVVAYDVSPRALILGRPDGVINVLNLENPTGFVTAAQSGTGGLTYGTGAVYHQPSRAVLTYHHGSGATIRKLTIPANPLTGTYVWSTVTNGAGGATPPGTLEGDFRGAFSKFNLIEDMGNGRGALVFVGNITQPTYVYKLPAGAI